MSRKVKKGGKRHAARRKPTPSRLSPSQLLPTFKSLWTNDSWGDALICYRTWTNRTGKNRDALLEAELLFRSASSCFHVGKYHRAVGYLDEALKLDTERPYRYVLCKAICTAKMGDLHGSMDMFRSVGDDYHCDVLRVLRDSGQTLPKETPRDLSFAKDALLEFWRSINEREELGSVSGALNSMARAYILFSRDEDPETALKPLEGEAGVESIVLYLLLLSAVHRRRNIRIRHIIEKNPAAFQNEDLKALLEIHLVLLLREGLFNEIAALDRILGSLGIETETRKGFRDAVSFHDAVGEIRRNRLENALEHFMEIRESTPAVVHNIALLLQKLQRYDEANDYWIRILRGEKKPRKSDPDDAKTAYASIAKYVARNYLRDERPADAMLYLREALTLLGNDTETLDALQTACLALGKKEEAVRYAERLYESEPENEEYLLNYIIGLSASRKLETVIPLYEKALEIDVHNSFLREGLYSSCVRRALELRKEWPERTRALMEKAEQAWEPDPLLTYLKAFFLRKQGKTKQAERAVGKAVEAVRAHYEEHELAKVLYEDGLVDPAMQLFESIASCDCEPSDSLFESTVKLLAENGDRENAVRICDLAMKTKGYHLYSISDMLRDYGRPSWALPYSERLIASRRADEDDRFLHLLILNDLGNGYETLKYAESLYERAMAENDAEDTALYKALTKEIRSRGRFKPARWGANI